jgi:secretion/DNA translocation related TadE-like protein
VNGDSGSVSIVAAVTIAVLAALTMGCADLARALVAVGRADTAADAAALAAAQELVAPTGSAPGSVAAEYAERNGATLMECSCEAGAADVTVAVEVQVGSMLLVPGDRSVTGRARAVVVFPQAGA